MALDARRLTSHHNNLVDIGTMQTGKKHPHQIEQQKMHREEKKWDV